MARSIFDLLLNINDFQALNSAIFPGQTQGQPQAQPSAQSFAGGTFFQLPGSEFTPSSSISPEAPVIPPVIPLLPGEGGDISGQEESPSGTPAAVDFSQGGNFGLTSPGVDLTQGILSGFGLPGVGIPTTGIGRTISNLNTLNAAKGFLGEEPIGLLSELLNARLITGQKTLRTVAEETVQKAQASFRQKAIAEASAKRARNLGQTLENQAAEEQLRASSAQAAFTERQEAAAQAAIKSGAARSTFGKSPAATQASNEAKAARAAASRADPVGASVAAESVARERAAQRRGKEANIELGDTPLGVGQVGGFGGTGTGGATTGGGTAGAEGNVGGGAGARGGESERSGR